MGFWRPVWVSPVVNAKEMGAVALTRRCRTLKPIRGVVGYFLASRIWDVSIP